MMDSYQHLESGNSGGYPATPLPCRVRARTDLPAASTPWLGENASLISNFNPSVAACTWVYGDLPPLRHFICCLDFKQPSHNKHHTSLIYYSTIWKYHVFHTKTVSLAQWLRHPSSSRAADPRFDSGLRRGNFSRSSHTSDLKIGTPVASLPGAWRYRVSAGTGWPGVSILWLGEAESWICNFYLSLEACKLVWADPYLRYTSMLLRR